MSLYPFDTTKISNQLNGALNFINTYTRNTFPLFFSTQYLAPNAFHNVAGRLGYFPANMGTSEAASILGIAFFKAFEATGNQGWKTLGLNQTESYAGHFFLDNIFTQANLGINTPLVRNHWLVITYGTAQTEGGQNGNDPFNFGTFTNHTFTNGIAQLPSNLSKFYKAYNGILHYQNLFAPLRSGIEYPIDYYVRQGFKVFANGITQATAEPNGRVQLISNFSGTLGCIYTQLNNSLLTAGNAPLTGGNMAEPYPLFFKCKEGAREYSSCATDTIWWQYEMFDKAFQHSGLTKYANAREITKWNAIKFLINRQIDTYYIKKEASDNPLRYPGSYALQYAVDVNGNNQTLPGFTISRETAIAQKNYVKLVINANSNPNVFSGVELQNFVTQTQIDPLVSITLEAASTVPQILELKLSLSPDALNFSQEYKAYWFITGGSVNQSKTFNFKSFLKFTNFDVWNISKAENPVFVYNAATFTFNQDIIQEIDTTVVNISMPTTSDGGGLINANYSNKIPNIIYSLSGNAQLRFKDNLNNFYYADISDTGGAWLVYSGSWQQFGVSARQLTEIAFQNSGTTQANLKLFYVGDAPEFLPSPAIVYKASVTDKSRLAHTLWIGNYRPNNNPLDKSPYQPGAIDFVLNTLNGAESGFYGRQYYMGYQSAYILDKWNLKNEAKNVIKLWNDSQESYRNQSIDKINGLLHQVFLPYSPENIPYLQKLTKSQNVVNFPIPFLNQKIQQVPTDSYKFNEFSWQGLDVNTSWSNYCNRAKEDLARYFYKNQNDSVARKILTNYLNFIYDYYQNNPTLTITDIPPNVSPQSNYFEPHSASIEGITCLFANLAGVELEKTFWLIQNRFSYIDNQFESNGAMAGSWTKNQQTFTANSITYKENFSFWHGKIVEFYSELLIYKDLIRVSETTTIPLFPNFSGLSNSFAHYITEITEATYPKITQKYAEGNQQTVLLTQNIVGKIIGMNFQNFDAVNVSTLINFYNGINKTSNGQFKFDLTKVNYSEFSGTWIFDVVPSIETVIANKNKGKFNISLKIKQILS